MLSLFYISYQIYIAYANYFFIIIIPFATVACGTERLKFVPVVIMTAYEELVTTPPELKNERVLIKPVRFDTWLEILDELVNIE